MSTVNSSAKTIIQKLDLDGYIHQFEQFFARVKPVAMHGDVNQHYRYIKALSTLQFPEPKEVPVLDGQLNRIKKQAVLGLDEIYAFVIITGLALKIHYISTIPSEAKVFGIKFQIILWVAPRERWNQEKVIRCLIDSS